ncbi:uncharacterized protein LOC130053473 [Ostrea edulis]|uniref:uncharacterized protein LOC130053473 n=1 Tax=Ostrea edulis TaxID=37623 RepID=UPI0024AF0D00|nr:uncharacterized protein LOC130053473 [Ostrea edulis]
MYWEKCQDQPPPQMYWEKCQDQPPPQMYWEKCQDQPPPQILPNELRHIIQDQRKLLNLEKFTIRSFSLQTIHIEQFHRLISRVSSLSITTEMSTGAVSSPPVKPLFDEQRIITAIDIDYDRLCSVVSLSEEVWTCGTDNIIKLYNSRGKLLKSIQTSSGNWPWDIAVTRDGDLFYTDRETRTVNLVKNKQIQTVITLQGWVPLNVCSTFSGDLLVTMVSDDDKQSKVVRYSGSTETQTIQFDDQGQPLYSSGHYNTKYLSENRNLDICVADWAAEAVVVVNQSGKLRFRYTGYPSNTKEPFYPRGITTDSQSHILTADFNNHRIHILDQDGQFLRYIQDCGLHVSWGLCVDIRDNLFVTEYWTCKLKKIQYLGDQVVISLDICHCSSFYVHVT